MAYALHYHYCLLNVVYNESCFIILCFCPDEPKVKELLQRDSKERTPGASESPTKGKADDLHKDPDSRKVTSVGVQCKRDNFAGYFMANPSLHLGDKYKHGHLMRVEVHPNGGAKVLHLWQDEISALPEKEVQGIAKDFIKVSPTPCPRCFARIIF